jgi:cyanuric acid amidohydrolase
LTPASIADADRRGKKLVTRDPNGSKPFARGATALGVALGLREVSEAELTDEVIARHMDLFSSVASTSAGGELKNCEILAFGNSSTAGGDFQIGHAILKDTIDADGVRAALRNAGLEFSGAPSVEDVKRVAGISRRMPVPMAVFGATHDDAVGRRYQL